MIPHLKKSTKTSSAKEMIYDYNTKNPLVTFLNVDIWVLKKFGLYSKKIVKFLMPMINVFYIVSFVAALLMLLGMIEIPKNNYQNRHQDKTKSMLIAMSDGSVTERDKLQNEFNLLKSKILNLEALIKKMNSQLETFYSNEKLKNNVLPDFASESAGGTIVGTPNTESYLNPSQIQTTLFGIPICKPSFFTPRKIIQPWKEPGECWAFHGVRGSIEIELVHLVYVQSVSLEHILKSASLTGSIESAPKEFQILGKADSGYIVLGIFIYDDEGASSQVFHLTSQDAENHPFKTIMLQVLSNYGNPEYTCIYRLRVHGKIYKSL